MDEPEINITPDPENVPEPEIASNDPISVEPETETEVIGRGKRTFVLYVEDPKETFTEVSRFRGNGPGNAAKKAASRGHTDIVIRETKKRKFRFYNGSIVDELILGPRSQWQRKLATEAGTFLYTTDGTLPEAWKDVVHDPNGVLVECDPATLDDPVLKGRCPIYDAKVGKAKYIRTEKVPKDMRLSHTTVPTAEPVPMEE